MAEMKSGDETTKDPELTKKKRELAELRVRAKIASEHAKAANDAKKEIMDRTKALAAELGKPFRGKKGKTGEA